MNHDFFPREVIVRYVQDHITKDDYRFSSDGNWINFNSVFGTDRKHHMGINIGRNLVKDLKLDRIWSLLAFVAEHQGLANDMEARTFLMKIAFGLRKLPNGGEPKETILAAELPTLDLLPDLRPFGPNMGPVGVKALKYLYARGIVAKHIRRFGLFYSEAKRCPICSGRGQVDGDERCPMCDGRALNPFHARIIIPTYENRKLVYFQGRALKEDAQLRYLNPKAPRLQVLYFHDLLMEGEDVFVTEGPFDAMTLFSNNATCMLNQRFEDPKILKLAARKPRRIIFVPQWEATAEKRALAERALARNIERTLLLANGIPVGVFHWYAKLPESNRPKDINEAQITVVDESLVEIKTPTGARSRKFTRSWEEADEYEPQSATASQGRPREPVPLSAIEPLFTSLSSQREEKIVQGGPGSEPSDH